MYSDMRKKHFLQCLYHDHYQKVIEPRKVTMLNNDFLRWVQKKSIFFHIGCILKITLAVEFSAIFYKLILKFFFFRRYVFCQIKPPRYKFLDVYLNSLNVTSFVEVLVKGFDIVICISS